MKKITEKYSIPKLVLALCLMSGITVFAARHEAVSRVLTGAAARPTVQVTIGGSVRRENKLVALDKIEAVGTGETVNWTIDSTNTGDAAAQNYRVVGKIPPGTTFVANSAAGDAEPTVRYSNDGGKTFSAAPTVEEKQADGSVKRVPALTESYTQIRFEWSQPLAADSKFNAAYQVRVK